MTAKVSGKTAVCSERQHKWAKLSLWRPSDLSERIPTCSLTSSFIYWSSRTFDLFTLKTPEDFPVSASSHSSCYTTFSLLPNSCEENNDLFLKIIALSLELAFLSNLSKCCVWVLLLKHVQQDLNQVLFLMHRIPFIEEDIAGTRHHSWYFLLWSFQVKQWKKYLPPLPVSIHSAPTEQTLALFLSEQHRVFYSSWQKHEPSSWIIKRSRQSGC